MNRTLAICIPTYNRADELDRQLGWLAREIQGVEQDCEVIVSDNASIDQTQAIIEKWRPAFAKTQLKVNLNSTNIGWIRNFNCCFQASECPHTWIIGDDDVIYDGTLHFVIRQLKEKPELALLYLNFLGRNVQTNQIQGEHWFDPALAESPLKGADLFQHCLEKDLGAVIFISAIVFRTALAQTAIRRWPNSLDNWSGVAVWAGFCAMQGEVKITQQNFLECIIGVSHWQKESRIHFKKRYADIPAVYHMLYEMGYPHHSCKQLTLQILREDFTSIAFLRSFVGSLLVKPVWTLKITLAFFKLVLSYFRRPVAASAGDRAVLGQFGQKLARLLALVRHSQDLARHAPHLPALSPADQRAVQSLSQTGVHQTSLTELAIPGTELMLAAAARYLHQMKLVLASAHQTAHSDLDATYPQIFTVTDLPEFATWASHPRLLAIVENYIGLPVAFQGVHLRRDFANPTPVTTELWHRDQEDRRIVKIFVYLTDATEEYGPLEYIPKHRLSWWTEMRLRFTLWRRKDRGLNDAEMAKIAPPSLWQRASVPQGGVVFADAVAIFHHGRSRQKERAALFFVYTAAQPLRPEHVLQYRDDTFARPATVAQSNSSGAIGQLCPPVPIGSASAKSTPGLNPLHRPFLDG
jgi:abequosyltransferase